MATRVVIIGSGFVGLSAARQLANDDRFAVTLISQRHCFEYHSALYRSATGRSPLEVAVPLLDIVDGMHNVRLVQATIEKVDAAKQQVSDSDGNHYAYDELIVGVGMTTAYFGIPGLQEHAYPLGSIDQAMRLRAHLREEVLSQPDGHYAVVGAGPSGVELAGELTCYLAQLRKRHRITAPYTVELIEAAPRILPTMPEPYARKVEARLKALGVVVYTSTAVRAETADKLTLPNGDLDTHTVIWTAGMANNTLFKAHPKLFKLGPRGRVAVDGQLQAYEHVWVGGDNAGTQLTGWAQTAAYDGRYIATNLQRAAEDKPALSYKPTPPVAAIPVGPRWCAVNEEGRSFYGYRGWLMRRWMDLALYRMVMPNGLAWRAWRHGRTAQED